MVEIIKHKTIDGNLFKKMFINGTINLKNKHKEINNLNVFPIPDGDTGTNMQMTMMKGVEKLKNIKDSSIIKVTKVLSDALLFGSKGNSGVILSQFFMGFYEKICKLQKKNINVCEFIESLDNGYKKAYNSILKPVEGTILTVLRESIEKIIKIKKNLKTIKEALQKLLKYANISLQKTPELLPILKKSNVVDSGGAGFVSFLEGMLLYLNNVLLTNIEKDQNSLYYLNNVNFIDEKHKILSKNEIIKYRYCTEFIFKLNNKDFNLKEKQEEFNQENVGDSLIFIQHKNNIKIHIHTNDPGNILNKLLKYGILLKSKIEDMQQQKNLFLKNKNKKNFIVAISSEPEIKKILQELKIDYYIIQKEEPSEKDFEKILAKAEVNNIIILPNNKKTIEKSLKFGKKFPQFNINIVKTQNIGQIYSSLLVYDKELSFEKNLKNMDQNIQKNKVSIIMNSNFLKYEKTKSKENQNLENKNFVAFVEKERIYNENLSNLNEQILKKIIKKQNRFLTIFYNKKNYVQENLKKIEYFIKKNFNNIEIEKIKMNNENYLYIFVLD
ncbi:DAK2 domain-containing protein [Candidatus Phytoplasma oryzae]|nr:DAK2 domain-containing protein [Candidatus Phytoplasma oryzae]